MLLPDEIQALTPFEINHYLKQLSSGKLEEKIKRVRAIFIGDGEAGNLQDVAKGEADQNVYDIGTPVAEEFTEW